jgi:FkbM family methyltransferase
MSVRSKLTGVRQMWRFDNRWHLLLSRLLFRRDSIGIYRRGALEILVDHAAGDASGPPDVFTHPMYADHLPLLTERRVVRLLDLGANVGAFPLFLAHHGVRFERVVSVELNPRTCVRLRFNLERNLAGDVAVVNAGLCGTNRPLELDLGAGSVADSLYAPSFNATGTLTPVPGRTFDAIYADAFGDRSVDICKIDVEGAEYEVFDSPGHDRLRGCRVLVIEIHERPGREVREVVDAITAMGFEAQPQGSDLSVHVFTNGSRRRPGDA